MGREVRCIRAGWQHPKDNVGNYIPLMKGPFSKRLAAWIEGNEKWSLGLREQWIYGHPSEWIPIEDKYTGMSFEEWEGPCPKVEDYMPEWAPDEATQLVMYEDTSEGTPISPAFGTPEELARWLADNNASAFGGSTASYESWLSICQRGSAVSAVLIDGVMMSGVAANTVI